jgi:prepilin-type N-terminal cleavage/methylation domain-containing protein
MFSRDKDGFTLIELLIVVAIIAILAAIAVPNFLEAQTRAKYARCYAETRNLATAIEEYRIDENIYPLTPHYADFGASNPCVNDGWGPPETQWARLIPITTPVAYISDLPMDQFDDNNQPYPASIWLVPGAENDPYNYQNLEVCEPESQIGGPTPPHPLYKSRYKVLSPGLHRDPYPIRWALPYDPTNGTVSNGVCGFTDLGIIRGQTFNYYNALGIP